MKTTILILLLPLCLQPVLAQQKPATAPVDPSVSRELIRQWMKTERLISAEKTAWQVEKQRLQSLLDLYAKEMKLLDEELSVAGSTAGKIDQRKQQLEKNIQQIRESNKTLSAALAKMLPRIKTITTRLPAPLVKELADDIETLQADDALTHPRETLKAVISVLSNSARFNRTASLHQEIRQIDGKKMTVQVLYLGLARAYFATQSGDLAGIGTPGKADWQWQKKPELADPIRQAIAVYQKDRQPQLIKLPVGVTSSSNK